MLKLLWLLAVAVAVAVAEPECNFTKDCFDIDRCKNVQDVGCVCLHGNCTFSGNPFFRGSECEQFEDCNCSSNPDECFCIGGFCREESWECHTNKDCNKLDKCQGIDCQCQGSVCEMECWTDDDCHEDGETCDQGVCSPGNQTSSTCEFTRDCSQVRMCEGIQDAACICNFGTCRLTGNPFFRGGECDTYKDCNCSSNPAECFCMDGFCREEKWECHEAKDCKSLAKCQDKDCACSGFVCEHDCDSDSDCDAGGNQTNPNYSKYSCNRQPGYQCKCKENLCEFEKLPAECTTTTDCVKIGKCENDKPCACTNDACTQPWYIGIPWRTGQFADKNCKNEDDCDYSLPMCAGDKCTCEDKEQVNEYEEWGVCQLK